MLKVALVEDTSPAAASTTMAVLGAFREMTVRSSGFPVVAALAAMSEGVHSILRLICYDAK